MVTHIWLRAEALRSAPSRGDIRQLENERRTVLSPDDARKLIEAGFKVTVERSAHRIFADQEYATAGCSLVDDGTWEHAPLDALILGLRAFKSHSQTLRHQHCFFGHVFKRQQGWQNLLQRFLRGNGVLYDLEYLADENGRRIVSFGRIAGFMGMAAGLIAWCKQKMSRLGVILPDDLLQKLEHLPLKEHVKALLQSASLVSGRKPRVVVIGGSGKAGSGVVEFAKNMGVEVTVWGRAETAKGGPFPELLEFDVLVNAIKLGDQPIQPFLTRETVRHEPRTLSVIVDMSCDTANPRNPLPVYSTNTTFENPSIRLLEHPTPLDIIAIPTLPSLVPEIASRDFSAQLLPLLLQLKESPTAHVWKRAGDVFIERSTPLRITASAAAVGVVSFGQERIFSLEEHNKMHNNGTAFTIGKLYRFAGALDLAKLDAAFLHLLSFSNVLRTSFAREVNGKVSATLHPAPATAVLEKLEAENEEAVRRLYEQHLKAPFDLGKPPLVRGSVVRTKDASLLMLFAHRIALDEQSLSLLARNLCRLHDGGPIPDASAQYHDFALWQMQHMSGAQKIPLECLRLPYFEEPLQGNLPILQLPTDFPRPPTPSFVCHSATHTVSQELEAAVLNATWLSPHEDPYLEALFLALFQLLLYRYTAEADIIVGTAVSGRAQAHVAAAMGPFENQLPIRLATDDDLTFAQLYHKALHAWRATMHHQDVPYDRLLHQLYPDAVRTQNPVPMFSVRFVSRSAKRLLHTSLMGLAVAPVRSLPQLTPYDLTLSLDTSHGIQLEAVYNATLFTKARFTEMFTQIELLLTQVLANQSQNILKYTLLTPHAATVLPDPKVALDPEWLGSIAHVFHEQAVKRPERIAVVFKEERITYQQLELRTNKLANSLIAAGLKKGEVVGLYGYRSPSVVWAIMGILKAGLAYSMMDPMYPSSRIMACMDIAKPRAWLQIAGAAEPPADLVQYLDGIGIVWRKTLPPFNSAEADAIFKDLSDAYPNIQVEKDDIAVVTFTSGSTGLPKGVMGRHVPLTHFYPWMHERFGIGEDDRFSMCSGIAHDPLQRDIFTPLFFGASIHIPTHDDITTPGRLAEWMAEQKVTVSCLTPAMGQLLTTVDNPNFTVPLKAVFFVGDCLIKRDVTRLRRLAPQVMCINMYGSTETQRAVGYYEVPPEETAASMKEVIPVGRGMKDVQVLVFNNARTLCAVGELGELYLRSPHLAKGYMALEGQSDAKFIVNPFTGVSWDRLYRTGDLGRYLPDGVAECIGRADDQVKIRGFRIELGEINANLSKHPSVKENVTIVREDTPGDKRLVSYVVPTTFDENGKPLAGAINAAELSKALREFLRKKLPTYMVPAHVVIIASMPLTPNGKINRGGLPAPEAQPRAQTESVTPANATQAALMKLWASLLNVQIDGVDANFFDLGGHSVVATQLMFQINKAFNVNLPTSALFDNPTVAGVAAAIEAVKSGGAAAKSGIDLLKEIALPDSINVTKDLKPLTAGAPSAVLLTGATGFLGSFILQQLLEQLPTAKVYCHVRATSVEDGLRRVQQTLTTCMIWKPEFAARIVPVLGDLGQPRLGLSEANWTALSTQIDAIVHNGAYVHWLLPYAKLRPSNVEATVEVLRFACTGRVKLVHYVSTTSVFDTKHHATMKSVPEDDPMATVDGLSGGYPQTKWVADKLAQLARTRGVPVNIYRPGYITGDSVNGVWNTDDFLCRLLKGCVQLGKLPAIDPTVPLDMAPVDYVAKTICALVQSGVANRSFNVVSQERNTYANFFMSLASFGYAISVVSYADWRAALTTAVNGRPDANVLSAVLAQFSEHWDQHLSNPVYEQGNIVSVLGEKRPAFPSLSALFAPYYTYLIAAGFLPAPAQKPTNQLNINWEKIQEGVATLTRTNRN